jgi:hypothetical protein
MAGWYDTSGVLGLMQQTANDRSAAFRRKGQIGYDAIVNPAMHIFNEHPKQQREAEQQQFMRDIAAKEFSLNQDKHALDVDRFKHTQAIDAGTLLGSYNNKPTLDAQRLNLQQQWRADDNAFEKEKFNADNAYKDRIFNNITVPELRNNTRRIQLISEANKLDQDRLALERAKLELSGQPKPLTEVDEARISAYEAEKELRQLEKQLAIDKARQQKPQKIEKLFADELAQAGFIGLPDEVKRGVEQAIREMPDFVQINSASTYDAWTPFGIGDRHSVLVQTRSGPRLLTFDNSGKLIRGETGQQAPAQQQAPITPRSSPSSQNEPVYANGMYYVNTPDGVYELTPAEFDEWRQAGGRLQ